MVTTVIETNSELDRAAEDFFAAAYRYCEALKRHAPQSLGGVLWVKRGGELLAYSEMGRYSQQIMSMTHDTAGDRLVFTEANDPHEEE